MGKFDLFSFLLGYGGGEESVGGSLVSVELTGEEDGSYVYTLTYSNGTTSTMKIPYTEASPAPYLYRAIPSGAGNMEQLRGIVGATICWNQLVNSTDTSVTVTSGHKYVAYISGAWSIGVSDGTAITVSGAGGDMVTDFTLMLMLGSAIADYAYSLEQATPGAGVAWLRSYGLFPEGASYAYDAGSLQSVKVSAHKTVGFNQWDEEYRLGNYSDSDGSYISAGVYLVNKNPIKVLPNTTYYKRTGLRIFFYDADMGFISNTGNTVGEFTTPSNCHFINFRSNGATTYGHDICINISDPAKNGDYLPYDAHTYLLDSTTEWRGIYKLDGTKLVADGDVYPPSGEATRKYGIRAYEAGDESLADAITDGTNTVYKLATPTSEAASPYSAVQICNPDGTEEYVDALVAAGTRDVAVPPGTDARYTSTPAYVVGEATA